jgi:hypothetical protein
VDLPELDPRTQQPVNYPQKPWVLSTFFPSNFSVHHLLTADPQRQTETKPRKKLKLNHSSRQTPKTCFIHNQVVGPLLLTLLPSRKSPKRFQIKKLGESSSKEKSPILERMGLENMPAIT